MTRTAKNVDKFGADVKHTINTANFGTNRTSYFGVVKGEPVVMIYDNMSSASSSQARGSSVVTFGRTRCLV